MRHFALTTSSIIQLQKTIFGPSKYTAKLFKCTVCLDYVIVENNHKIYDTFYL